MQPDWYVRARGAVGGRRCAGRVCARGGSNTQYTFRYETGAGEPKMQGGVGTLCALVHDKDTDTDELRGLHPNLSRKLAPITCLSGVSVHVPTRVFGVAILWVLYCIRWPSGQLTTVT